MTLNEILDTPIKFEKDPTPLFAGRDEYVFMSGEDELRLCFAKEKSKDDKLIYRFDFDRLEAGQMMPESGITNSGDSIKVFATVIAIIKEFVKTKHPDVLTTGCEPSRVSMYTKMIQKVASKIGYTLEDVKNNTFRMVKDATS